MVKRKQTRDNRNGNPGDGTASVRPAKAYVAAAALRVPVSAPGT